MKHQNFDDVTLCKQVTEEQENVVIVLDLEHGNTESYHASTMIRDFVFLSWKIGSR